MKIRSIGMIVLSVALFYVAGCASSSASKSEAKKGAAYGALGGAVSGFFWGLFSGNPLENAAQGAVVGGATGATMGAVHGGQKDKKLKEKYGEENYKALMALVDRDYPTAEKFVKEAQASSNIDYKRASIWLSVLIAKEQGESAEVLNKYYQQLIQLDPTIKTQRDAEAKANQVLGKLGGLRNQLNVK